MQKDHYQYAVKVATRQDLVALGSWHSANDTHWGVVSLLNILKQSQYSIQVIRKAQSSDPVGFMVYQVVLDECELLYIAVDIQQRRQGAAQALINMLISLSVEQLVSSIFLEVRASNEAARSLYEKVGFKTIGVRKNYYSTNTFCVDQSKKEDAILYQYTLNLK